VSGAAPIGIEGKVMTETPQPTGPDLQAGIAEAELADGSMLVGYVGQHAVLIARRGAELFAVDATCTHYGGPLGEGLMVADTVRCPWHHSCFSLRSGEALTAPALNSLRCWRIERERGQIRVKERVPAETRRPAARRTTAPVAAERIVIIGGGAAGFAAAEMLRRESFDGELTLISADEAAPYDRPNLSKDYLAGTAPEDWIPLRPAEFYAQHDIDLRLSTQATAIDLERRQISVAGGEAIAYTKLLIATGAEPVRLEVPGKDLPHVRTLRSFADCRGIIDSTKAARRAVIVGASFIGLEAAAALRQRSLELHVVAPEARPMERVLGPGAGDFIRSLHESHGVVFHLGRTVAAIDAQRVQLSDGARIDADVVVVGVGVRPRIALAEKAGLAIDRGVLVDEHLETSAPGVFAAGDIARWPDPYTGERLRIEHWVVAERQGQTAARNMLGRRERFAAVPFFWTQQYDVSIDYVGHAAAWDSIEQRGELNARDVALRFRRGDHTLAVATIFRGRESLEAELAMEQGRAP
jgi:apoptosis-inducing factor 3